MIPDLIYDHCSAPLFLEVGDEGLLGQHHVEGHFLIGGEGVRHGGLDDCLGIAVTISTFVMILSSTGTVVISYPVIQLPVIQLSVIQ